MAGIERLKIIVGGVNAEKVGAHLADDHFVAAGAPLSREQECEGASVTRHQGRPHVVPPQPDLTIPKGSLLNR